MPDVPFGVPVKPADLLARLVGRVVSSTGLPADLVFETLATDDDHLGQPPADRFATVSGLAFPLGDGAAGGGRYLTGYNWSPRVALFSRVSTDQDLRSANALRDKTRGLLVLAHALVDGLQMWPCYVGVGTDLDDPTNGSYLREPARLLPPGLRVLPKRRPGQLWAVAETSWQLKFTAALTVDPLPP